MIRRLEDDFYFKSIDNAKNDVSFVEFLVAHTSRIHLYGRRRVTETRTT